MSKKIIEKIRSVLDLPFPEDTSFVGEVKSSAFVGLFIFLFLFVFKPFGIHSAGHDAFRYCLYFGMATMMVSIVYNLILDFIFQIDRSSETWTFWKWILSVLVLIVFIAYANYLILYYIYDGFSIRWLTFLNITFVTLLVGLFPTIFSGMLILITSKKKNEATARNFHFGNQKNNQSLTIPNGERQNLELSSEDFLCAEAMQNYVSIFYVREHELTKELVRIPIKQLEELIGSQSIVRCHRSFIVNKDKINAISGNSQGLKLKIEDLTFEIPVSRTYLDLFR